MQLLEHDDRKRWIDRTVCKHEEDHYIPKGKRSQVSSFGRVTDKWIYAVHDCRDARKEVIFLDYR